MSGDTLKSLLQKKKKIIFFEMIEDYHINKTAKEDLIEEVKKLLKKYPNTYLEQSTFINGGKDETLA